jgi:hypothetical protein
MESKRHALLLGGALLGSFTSAVMADSATTTDLSAQIDALKAQVAGQQAQAAAQQAQAEARAEAQQGQIAAQQARIADLEAKSDQKWLNEQRTEEVKGLIRDALADADTRASLAADGATAGNDGRFFIKSADDSFRLNIGGLFAFRYVADLRGVKNPGANPTPDISALSGHEDGFQMRRFEVFFTGYLGDPQIDYSVTLRYDDFGSQGAPNMDELLELGHTFDLGKTALRVFGGRFHDRFSREIQMGGPHMQQVEASTVSYILAAGDDVTEGVGVEWNPLPEYLKVAATFNNGIGAGSEIPSALTPAHDDYFSQRVDYAFTTRADVKLAGDWAQASDMESWSTSPGFAAFLGAGYKFNEAKHGDAGIDATVNNLLTGVPMFNLGQTSEFTVDSLIKCHGLGLMGSFYGLYLNDISTPTPGPTSAQWYGATAQAGYLIADRVEPFVRYEWLFPDQGLTHGSNQINIVTTGATYYIRKHAAKFTLDCMWCLDNINPSSTLDTILVGTGLTFDAPNRTGQVVLRAQFQFMF